MSFWKGLIKLNSMYRCVEKAEICVMADYVAKRFSGSNAPEKFQVTNTAAINYKTISSKIL